MLNDRKTGALMSEDGHPVVVTHPTFTGDGAPEVAARLGVEGWTDAQINFMLNLLYPTKDARVGNAGLFDLGVALGAELRRREQERESPTAGFARREEGGHSA